MAEQLPSRKRGKGSNEAEPAKKRKDKSDLGDPRGTRAPADTASRKSDHWGAEKGDKRRHRDK